MIALVRVRWNKTPPANVWTDAVMNDWMNPTIPFSLAHYWTRTSLFLADMRYYLFPPIAIDDPRLNTPAGGDQRQDLVNVALSEVTRLFSPDWNLFERAILVFAQPTDLFGGGAYIVPVGDGKKTIPAAICDVASPFDAIVQEVGHAFGLDHEIDDAGNEYMSPYSAMSSEKYGNARPGPSFQRPIDNRLPKGVSKDTPPKDVQLTIGPYITPVQLYISKSMPLFKDSETIYFIPTSYYAAPHSFRLTAVDAAIDSWPVRKKMLAVLPSVIPGGDTYFLELRRSRSYDAGLSLDGANGAPVALAVHAFNAQTGRVRYVNRVALVASPGDHDYHCYQGRFTVRLNSFEADFSSCSVTVGGGDFWKYFGVNLDDVLTNQSQQPDGELSTADVSPCFMFPKSPHYYRYHFNSTEIVFTASSFGYEKPNYSWFINDQFFDPANSQMQFKSAVRTFVNGTSTAPVEQDVTVQYVQTQNTIKLTFNQAFAGVYATIKVTVNESSPEVIQSLYPDRSVWTGIAFDNVSVHWDQAYYDAQKACEKRIREINDHYSISQSSIHRRNPGPQFGVNIIALINELVVSNPAVANVVINEVARLGNIGKLEVIKKLR